MAYLLPVELRAHARDRKKKQEARHARPQPTAARRTEAQYAGTLPMKSRLPRSTPLWRKMA
jgi:hypothetical protein